MKKLLALLAFFAMFFLISCDEDDDADDHDDKHFEPVIWNIYLMDDLTMRINNGEFDLSYQQALGLANDEIGLYWIEFIDDDNDVIELDDENSLNFVFDNDNIARISNINSNSFTLAPFSSTTSGTTNLEIQILHGDDGHVDRRTPKIPIIIN
jgi:hypothetical protein